MFSQNNEEQYILDFFKDKTGRFLDIGAYDGKTFSNTHALALKGWSGVCVEPSPRACAGLIDLYRDNPNIIIINAAVVSDYVVNRKLIEFYDSGGDAISTLNEAHKAKWDSRAKYRKIFVSPIYLLRIYEVCGYDFDFVNIDVEGCNINLFEGLDFRSPQMICVEHDSEQVRLEQVKEVYGFKTILENGENIIMVKDANKQAEDQT